MGEGWAGGSVCVGGGGATSYKKETERNDGRSESHSESKAEPGCLDVQRT